MDLRIIYQANKTMLDFATVSTYYNIVTVEANWIFTPNLFSRNELTILQPYIVVYNLSRTSLHVKGICLNVDPLKRSSYSNTVSSSEPLS